MGDIKAYRCKHIYTADSPILIDGFLITEDEKILAIEPFGSADPHLNKATEVYNYEDGFLMPGIHDYHVHVLMGAMMERDGDLRYAKSEEEAARQIWEKCAGREQEWILAMAWDHFLWENQRLPAKESLDQYFPDKPVFLLNKECHGAWVNSNALDKLGITRNTPDPEGGEYSRDKDGNPTGYLHESAMMPFLERIYRSISKKDATEAIEAFQCKANRYGITSVGDVSSYGISNEMIYEEMDREGNLTIRIHFSKDINEPMEELKKAAAHYKGPMVRFNGVKGFIDGTPMGHTGYMIEPYSDMPGFRSEPLIPWESLCQMVQEYDREGIRVRIHACGDGGVRICLDAYEFATKENGLTGLRHAIEHIECTTPEDVERFGKLEVIPSVQPDHMPKYDFAHHPFHTMVGEARMKHCWPFKSLLDSAGNIAYGTDFPVAPLAPARGIWRAVTRLTDAGDPKGGWNPEERLSVHEALRACTHGSAYAAGRENELGLLAPGMLADFTIYPLNLMEAIGSREQMFEQEALLTVVGGKIVYQMNGGR